MDITKIPQHILDDLRSRGNTDEEIKEMSPECAFSEFCEWNGLNGWASTLRNALDILRVADKKSA